VLILDPEAGSHRETAKKATPDTQNPDVAMTGKMMAAAGGYWCEGHGSKAHQFLQPALEAGPPTHWPRSSSS